MALTVDEVKKSAPHGRQRYFQSLHGFHLGQPLALMEVKITKKMHH